MKNLRAIVFVLVLALVFTTSSIVTLADAAITIDSVIFEEYVDELGATDEDLVTVKVSFTTVVAPKQISLLLTSEDISEITDATKSKVIYITQDVPSEVGKYEFVIEKSRLQTATGLTDVDGCSMIIKMGALDIDDMASKTITFEDPYGSDVIPGDVDGDGEVLSRDGTFLLRYLAGWPLDNVQVEAMDVDDDGEVLSRDGTFLLRYLAGWPIELK